MPGPGTCKQSVAKASRTCFLTASADGTAVLLSDGRLYGLNGAGNAYEPSTDLSEGEGGFKGILGAAQDLSRIYFVDSADLSGGEENENEEEAEAGALNLYAWSEGTASFIGALAPRTTPNPTASEPGGRCPTNRAAQASRRRELPRIHVKGAADGL